MTRESIKVVSRRSESIGITKCQCNCRSRAGLLLLALAVAQPAFGQVAEPGGATQEAGRGGRGWATGASVSTIATLTNNANYGDSDVRAGDLILEAIPAFWFNRKGSRLQIDGTVALDGRVFVDGTQANSILPRANVAASLEAVDNLFFVDASVRVDQQVENPFLPAAGSAFGNNLYTSTQVRLAPYLKGTIGPRTSWQLRSDNSYTWTSRTSVPLDNIYYVSNLAEVVRSPAPFGITFRLTNDVTRVRGQLQQDQVLNTALALPNYAVSPQLMLGLRGGYENSTYTGVEVSGPIYGASIDWRPSPLTSLVGYWEERFYGPSYQVDFSHRHRRVASTVSAYRTITTYPQVLFRLPGTSSVAGLLDAIFTARFPDPVERAGQVQDLIGRQGLPPALPEGTYIYNQSASVLTGGRAGWALVGVRNTLVINFYYLKTKYLPDPRLPPSFLEFDNTLQQGASLTLSHRVSPVVDLNGTVSTNLTKQTETEDGLDTRENVASVQVSWRVSPRSSLFIGARYQVQDSSRSDFSATAASEAAVFAGLFHRL